MDKVSKDLIIKVDQEAENRLKFDSYRGCELLCQLERQDRGLMSQGLGPEEFYVSCQLAQIRVEPYFVYEAAIWDAQKECTYRPGGARNYGRN